MGRFSGQLFGIFFMLLVTYLDGVHSHGRLMDPVQRGSAWRKGFRTPINYDDNQNFCGGFSIQYGLNKGKCGPCGDNFATRRPRLNENGGKYGRGTIVKHYRAGEKVEIVVEVTANHIGYFTFAVCPLTTPKGIETNECFDKHPVMIILPDNRETDRFYLRDRFIGFVHINVTIPEDVNCENCVFRWHWRTGRNWGRCRDGSSRVGCGNQEIFRSCADVTILDYKNSGIFR